MAPTHFVRTWQLFFAGALGCAAWNGGAFRATADSPVKVQVEYEKDQTLEAVGPVDPTPRMRFQQLGQTFAMLMTDEMGRRLHLSHFPSLKIDGAASVPGPGGIGGAWEMANGPLPKKGGKERSGYMKVWSNGDLRITQTVELTPSKAVVDGKRRLDSALVRYTLENKGKAAHTVGLRTCIDSYLINQRNCKFAAPNRLGKLLDGLELKDKDVPPYLQILQMPDLKNPGVVAHVTWALGSGLERPERVVLTNIQGRRDLWDLQIMANGFNSLVGFYWEPKELRPGAKRELGYAFGTGLAAPLGADANFQIQLGGSFEKGKLFSVSALVADPAEGQSLELELPKGLERVQGKQIQPVPAPDGEEPMSMVLWKCRVHEYGSFPIRIRASAGVTKTAKVTIGPGN